jgi:hypothetical protein
MHFLSQEDSEEWIMDDVERVTAVARMQVQDAETPIMQKQEAMANVEHGRSTNTKHEIPSERMVDAIGVRLSDLAYSEDEKDGEYDDDDDEDPEHGNLSDRDKPG